MDDKIKIKLMIVDTYYPMTIEREDEGLVRKAAKQVNDKLNKYRTYFPNLEPEKFLAMVALELSTDHLRLENKNDTSPYTERIKELTEELENYFRKG